MRTVQRYPRLRVAVLWGGMMSALLVGAYVIGYVWRTDLITLQEPGHAAVHWRACSEEWEVEFWSLGSHVEGMIVNKNISVVQFPSTK